MPGDRVVYGHIAGHFEEAEDLRVDTHGASVIEGVWDLLDAAFDTFGPYPTLLERDFNFPAVGELLEEVGRIADAQARAAHVPPARPAPPDPAATITADGVKPEPARHGA
jgi:uncharacterized protein (UPF0276 family)